MQLKDLNSIIVLLFILSAVMIVAGGNVEFTGKVTSTSIKSESELQQISSIVGTRILIASSPSGAKVYLDGAYKGVTPIIIKAVKNAQLTLTYPGYEDYTTQITGKTKQIKVALIQKKGSISADSTPQGAAVYLNGTNKGNTPIVLSNLPAGNYELMFALQGYNDFTQVVKVEGGETSFVNKVLDPVIETSCDQINDEEIFTISSGRKLQYKDIDPGPSQIDQQGSIKLRDTKTGETSVWNYALFTGTLSFDGEEYPFRVSTDTNIAILSVTCEPIIKTGSIYVTSTPSQATVYLDSNRLIGQTPTNVTDIESGNHILTFVKTGYDQHTVTVSVIEGQTTTVQEVLEQTMGAIYVTSNPEGANVYVDNVLKNITYATVRATVGNHNITVNKTGYNSRSEIKYFSTSTVGTYHAQLTSVATTGSIYASSNPTGASVYLDNVFKGLTPFTITGISAGTHTYKFTRTNYSNMTGTITVTGNQVTNLIVTLNRSTGTIYATSNPTGASFYLNEVYKGITPLTITNLGTGIYTAKFSKQGYNNYTTFPWVYSGQTTTVTATLTVAPGTLSVASSPSGSMLFVNSTYKGGVPGTYELSAGTYNLTFRKEGYADNKTVATISPGQTTAISVILSPTVTTLLPPSSSYKRVFKTSNSGYQGNLVVAANSLPGNSVSRGLDAADKICQHIANRSNLGGRWKAWLSDSQTSASSRLNHSSLPYKKLNGVTIANNWADLTDGFLQSPVDITELGTNALDAGAWTNTLPNGERKYTTSAETCDNWLTAQGCQIINGQQYCPKKGSQGVSFGTNSLWTDYSTYACSFNDGLYCFEQ